MKGTLAGYNWTWEVLKLIATSQAANRSVNMVGHSIRQHAIVSLFVVGLGQPLAAVLSNGRFSTT